MDTGSPVADTYKPPFAFTGEIEKVDIDLHPSNLSEEDLQILRETEAAYASFKE